MAREHLHLYARLTGATESAPVPESTAHLS
jgi:hypothetical protein